MAADKARQERLGVTVLSVGALFLGVTGWIDRPEPGEIAERLPGWYMGFKAVLHGAILVLLLVGLARVRGMTAETPALRLPLTLMILAGILGAAYVLGLDLGML